MATQDQLHEAYAAFRIPIGSSWETIKKRYKVLVRIWHPDRQGESLQSDAEQELKEINHFYQDVFKPHFEGGEHRDDRYCICQTVPSSQAKKESEPEQPQHEEPPPKPEPAPEAKPEPEPEFDSKFVWQPNFESKFEEAAKTKPVSRNRQRDAALACGLVFAGLCIFSLFINSTKHTFANLFSSAPAQTHVATNTQITPAPKISYVPAVSSVHAVSDDAKRAITYNKTKIDAIKRDIETLQAQIKWANRESSGQLFRELGVKDEELRQLQARTFELER
ncbi:J domain-containing protein [bacterium]|nr:J domain-containing protein [bacterium]